MKRFVSVLLVITVLLALGVPAFAAGSPTGSGKKDEAITGLVLYNSDGKPIGTVPTKDIIRYNTGDFAYARYYFSTVGRNIGVSVNGKDMDVGRLGNGNYYAKLTEFGTVVVTRN